jgi:hypothetical protein
MLKQEVYQKTSDVFGVSVGMANIIGFTNLIDESNEKDFTPEEYKGVSDEIDINMIICKAIENGKYRELQNNLYTLNKKRHARIKDITIYKKAWKEVANGSK